MLSSERCREVDELLRLLEAREQIVLFEPLVIVVLTEKAVRVAVIALTANEE
jgi:hypothetical protein